MSSMNPFAKEAKRAREHSCKREKTNLYSPTENQILIFQVQRHVIGNSVG